MSILVERFLPWILILCLIATGLILITPYLPGADAVSYISIAQKYASGQWPEAINGHWSPLFSWLLIPFIRLKIDPIIAAKSLCVLIGGFTLFTFWLLLKNFFFGEKERAIFWVIIFTAFPLILHHALVAITPDLLVTSIILLYLSFLLRLSYFNSYKMPIICSLLGSLCYLAKSYGFPFFLSSFFFYHFYYLVFEGKKIGRKKILSFFFLGLFVFIVTSFPWVYSLRQKYGYWTISTASRFNFAQIAPHIAFKQMELWGLVAPPNESALSYWEDPKVIPYKPWSPLSSREDFLYWIRRIRKNLKDLILTIWDDSWLAPLILLLGLILSFWPRLYKSAFLITMNSLIYSSGFILLFILDRYIYFVEFCLLLLGGYLLRLILWSKKKGVTLIFFVALFIFSFSFIIKPVFLIHKICTNNPVTPFRETDKEIYFWAKGVDRVLSRHDYSYRRKKKQIDYHLPLANVATLGNWNRGIFVSYYLRLRYFGDLMPYEPEQIISELRRYKIDYLLVFGLRWPQEKVLSLLPVVIKQRHFRLYDVRSIQERDSRIGQI